MSTIGRLPTVRTTLPGPGSLRRLEREQRPPGRSACGERRFARVPPPPPLTIEEKRLDPVLEVPEDASAAAWRARE